MGTAHCWRVLPFNWPWNYSTYNFKNWHRMIEGLITYTYCLFFLRALRPFGASLLMSIFASRNLNVCLHWMIKSSITLCHCYTSLKVEYHQHIWDHYFNLSIPIHFWLTEPVILSATLHKRPTSIQLVSVLCISSHRNFHLVFSAADTSGLRSFLCLML